MAFGLTRAAPKFWARIGLMALGAVGPATAAAQKPYTIFHPTPWSAARELTTDRPDKTESPYTVPAGRLQFEIDLINYTRDISGTGPGRTRFETLAIAPVNIKVGLVRNVDLQLVLETYVRNRERALATGVTSAAGRFGEVTGRVKINFWGNDGGRTAVGIIPFVSLVPSDAGGRYANGGLILPLALDLGAGFGLGTMVEVDFDRSDGAGPRHPVFVNSVTVGHELGRSVGTYAELFSATSTEARARWIGGFDFGFTRTIGTNAQLDLGTNLGLSRAADDFNPFLGLSFRF